MFYKHVPSSYFRDDILLMSLFMLILYIIAIVMHVIKLFFPRLKLASTSNPSVMKFERLFHINVLSKCSSHTDLMTMLLFQLNTVSKYQTTLTMFICSIQVRGLRFQVLKIPSWTMYCIFLLLYWYPFFFHIMCTLWKPVIVMY